jgi:1,4-dihydroxy-2-naphthoate octaprenyltransferase
MAVAWVPLAVVFGLTSLATLIALAALPFAAKAIRITLREFSNTGKLVPALAANIATAYFTLALLAVGYYTSSAIRL